MDAILDELDELLRLEILTPAEEERVEYLQSLLGVGET